ncbi:MAG TPA: efflux RND transporter permease subunit [Pirellulales bacterium]|nr:efflux RND transporter permease subunit [Pirellulales bacterium]
MNGLIRASLKNPYAVTVMMLTLLVLGSLTLTKIPIDILPIFKSPAVQVLTFYGGMPASNIEKDITNRMERWTGQAAGTARQESRSIVGASIIRNYYREDIDPNGALTQVNSLASAAIPNLPPGTLPPVVLPFDPTSTVPACLVALDSHGKQTEAIMYDVGRYEVRNFIMASPGAVAPVVYGGKIRAVLAYLHRDKLQARGLSPLDVMNALDAYNIFLPTGDAKFGTMDVAIDSNSMYDLVEQMGDIPLRTVHGNAAYLRDVATPKDTAFIQTNVVRVNGQRQVYIPVYRQLGSSTLAVVNSLKEAVPNMQNRLSRGGIDLKVVMDQSVYVKQSIESLAEEGILGAILCSLVILLFLGEWRMTLIAVMTIPVSVLAAIIFLYYTGNTINVMTLAGLSLAIGPLVDSAIICLENTHRHLGMGASPSEAAFLGASEVAMPELVASCCTLLVLAPLAMMPGMGQFLFKPMAMAVAFAMIAAYLLSRSFVPARCAGWLKSHGAQHGGHGEGEHGHAAAHHKPGLLSRAFARWEGVIEVGIGWYVRRLETVLNNRLTTVGVAVVLLVTVVLGLGSQLRREFFPEVDAGAFEMTMRAPTGTRIEKTEEAVAEVENVIKDKLGEDLQVVISELGVTPDWSAAYTPNSGPMDSILKIQLEEHRHRSAQEYVHILREALRRIHASPAWNSRSTRAA